MKFKRSCYHVKSFEEYWQEMLENEFVGMPEEFLNTMVKPVAVHAWHSAVVNCMNYTSQNMPEYGRLIYQSIKSFDASPVANGVEY